MNLYLVVSKDELSYVDVISSEIGGPAEYYRIADLVLADTPAQAKYLAWKNDPEQCHWDITEIPAFYYECKAKDIRGGKPRVVTWDKRYNADANWIFTGRKRFGGEVLT